MFIINICLKYNNLKCNTQVNPGNICNSIKDHRAV